MLRFKKITFLVIMLSFTFVAAPIWADQEEGMIKYRKNIMKANKGHIGAIMDIMKNGLPLQSHIVNHAQAIHNNSKMTLAAFPEGSDFGETRAKANIWEEWSDFEKAAAATNAASLKLIKAAESGNMKSVGKALQAMGKTCGSCHKQFREKK